MTLKLLTSADVLAEFSIWLAEQPDTPARRWVEENMPGPREVRLARYVLAA